MSTAPTLWRFVETEPLLKMQDTMATVILLTHSDSLLSTYHVTATASAFEGALTFGRNQNEKLLEKCPLPPSRKEKKQVFKRVNTF